MFAYDIWEARFGICTIAEKYEFKIKIKVAHT